jgi:hypothetical protein
MIDDRTKGNPGMTIELTCSQEGVTVSVEGWVESDAVTIRNLPFGPVFDLSTLDPRLQGQACIANPNATYCALYGTGGGPTSVDGRPLNPGDRVLIRKGGVIVWT